MKDNTEPKRSTLIGLLGLLKWVLFIFAYVQIGFAVESSGLIVEPYYWSLYGACWGILAYMIA